MSVDAGLKHLKVISRGEDVAGSEFRSLGVIGIKELAKALVQFLSNLTCEWVLGVRKPRVFNKEGFRGLGDN